MLKEMVRSGRKELKTNNINVKKLKKKVGSLERIKLGNKHWEGSSMGGRKSSKADFTDSQGEPEYYDNRDVIVEVNENLEGTGQRYQA